MTAALNFKMQDKYKNGFLWRKKMPVINKKIRIYSLGKSSEAYLMFIKHS